jgi:adenylate cyclase
MSKPADTVVQLWRRHPWLLRIAALLLAAAAAVLPVLLAPLSIARLEDGFGDAVWRWGANAAPERRVVLVDIDEKSLRELGPWPWPRTTLAELSTRLNAAQVRVQAFDIAFSDPKPGDAALATALQGSAAVLAQVFSLDAQVTPQVGTVAGPLAVPGCPAFAPLSHGHYATAEELLTAQPTLGHITPRVAADGVVRHVPALVCSGQRAYPSLGLATLWRAAQPAAGQGASPLPAPDWRWFTADAAASSMSPFPWGLAPSAWLSAASLPGLVVPLDAQGNLRVPFGVARDAFASVSAVDVLRGRGDLRLLNGAIAVVGATAFGIGDTIATPMSAVASGLEVHAQELVGLLDQRVPYTPHHWPAMQSVGMVVLALLLVAVAVGRGAVPAKRLPLIGAAVALLLLLGAAWAALSWSLWLPWWPLVSFVVLASLALATAEHALVRAQRERLSAHLEAYLPATVAQRLMATEPSGTLQLEQRHISVLVADIRNFNALATHAKPDEVAALLHAYCCMAVDVVERHGGVVENVVGDSITAVWTATPGGQGHASQAVAAAREMLRVSRPLLASSRPVAEDSPVQPLALGIGVESGLAIVGSYGPARRRAHAALGEPVSVANKIQQMTADLSIPVLVGPQLAASLPAEAVEPLGDYLLEGLGKHCRLFAPTGWADLAPVDSNWAHSAIGPGDKALEASDWSKWGEAPKSGISAAKAAAGMAAMQPPLRRFSA